MRNFVLKEDKYSVKMSVLEKMLLNLHDKQTNKRQPI